MFKLPLWPKPLCISKTGVFDLDAFQSIDKLNVESQCRFPLRMHHHYTTAAE